MAAFLPLGRFWKGQAGYEEGSETAGLCKRFLRQRVDGVSKIPTIFMWNQLQGILGNSPTQGRQCRPWVSFTPCPNAALNIACEVWRK